MKINKLFRMDEIFTIYKGKRLTKADMIEGDLNYIGAISDNNGVRQKIDAIKQFDGNCITVNYNGSVGEAFYQDKPFWASDDVNVLKLKNCQLNEKLALYIITLIKANRYRFSYGRKWTLEKMSETEISLPVDDYQNPDWMYMQNYISMIKSCHITSQNNKSIIPFFVDDWKEFSIGGENGLFITETGKDLLYYTLTAGEYDVIGHGKTNLGVTATTEKLDDYKLYNPSKTISLGDRGNFYASAHTKPFYIGTRTKALTAKFDSNIYILLFICTIINLEEYRHSYGRNCTDKLDELIIKLPVTSDGDPDFKYMENYIKSLPYSDRI